MTRYLVVIKIKNNYYTHQDQYIYTASRQIIPIPNIKLSTDDFYDKLLDYKNHELVSNIVQDILRIQETLICNVLVDRYFVNHISNHKEEYFELLKNFSGYKGKLNIKFVPISFEAEHTIEADIEDLQLYNELEEYRKNMNIAKTNYEKWSEKVLEIEKKLGVDNDES